MQAPPAYSANPGTFGYQQLASGRPAALPRPAADFARSMFGPMVPMEPMPIDDPATPRRWQYPVGWNMPIGTPGTEFGIKLASFQSLRALADLYSIGRSAIQVRKAEILGLDWDIVPTQAAGKAMRLNKAAAEDFAKRRAEAVRFFRRPDSNYHDYGAWLNALLEEVFVIDALSLHLHPTRLPGRGLFGSDLAPGGLEIVAGDTIRPLVDNRGAIPRAPNVAYQQYLWGVPRVDLMEVMADADLEAMREAGQDTQPAAAYSASQLLYLPYERRAWTPYGFPGIERALLPFITGLKRQQYWLEWWTEGTVPGMFIDPGATVSTPAQQRQLQDILNGYAGDSAWKHKNVVLPPGSKPYPMQMHDAMNDQFDSTLAEQVLMAYDVQPMELGLLPGGAQSGLGGKGMGEASENINQRKATRPLLLFLKRSIFDFVLQTLCGQEDMEWHFDGMDPAEDEVAQEASLRADVGAGIRSVDEARIERGLDPWGTPYTSDPVLFTATGPIRLTATEELDAKLAPPPPPVPPQSGPSAPPPEGGGGGAARGAPRNRPPGGGGTTLHAAGDQARATAAKIAELGAFGQYLRHKRDPERFRFNALEAPEVGRLLGKLRAGVEPRVALADARKVVGAQGRQRKRTAALVPIVGAVAGKLGAAARPLATDSEDQASFLRDALETMREGYEDAYEAGAVDAAGAGFTLDAAALAALVALVDRQAGYLTGLAQDISGGALSEDELAARLDQYGATAQVPYEMGYGDGVASTVGDGEHLEIEWVATADDPCPLCEERNGTIYLSDDDLPGVPGDGDFGELCEGAFNCRCVLVYTMVPDEDGGAAGDGGDTAEMAATADVVKVAAGQQGCMVALVPPADVADAIARPGGEAATELHLTLAYMGDSVDDAALGRLLDVVRALAHGAAPVTGSINGVARFSGTDKDPVVLTADLPALPALRQRLVDGLTAAGFAPRDDHGFTPHITVAYVAPETLLPPTRQPALPVTFDALWVWNGGQRIRVPFALQA